MIPPVTEDEFKRLVLEARRPVLVWFTVPNCPPCRKIAPRIEEVHRRFKSEVDFFTLNVEEYAKVAQRYSVLSTPTLVFFKEGADIRRLDVLPSVEKILGTIEELYA